MPETADKVINACGVKVELDDALGVLKDISGTGNEVNVDLDNELGEYKVFRDAWKYRIACARDGSFELTIFYSTGADGGLKVVRDWYFQAPTTARTIRVTVGTDYYEAEVKIEKLTIPLKSDDAKPIAVKATLKAHGAVTQATAA